MGDFFSTKTEVKNCICARVPLIVIDSGERDRVERMLREIAREMNISIPYYTASRQVVTLGGTGTEDADHDPLSYIASTFRKKRGVVFALGDGRRIDEDQFYTREMLDILYLAAEQSCTLIVITSDPVWPRLMRFGMIIRLGSPTTEERLAQLNAFVERYKDRFPIDWQPEDLSHAAMLLRGFTEMQIENVLSAEIISAGALYRENLSALTDQKTRLYASVPCVQQVSVPDNLRVSGLSRLKDWLAEKKSIFFASDKLLASRGLTPPKGILLTGIPGCGKSYSAKMIAHDWEMPLLRFDIGSIFNKWQGESERRMEDALRFIDNVAPCVVWIDEIEKALAVSDDGNDTGKRILGQFLFWLQESESRVFLVSTANDITRLPPELFRKGRFSEVFFIDLPNAEERKEAILQYGRRCLPGLIGNELAMELTWLSNGYSYADIEHVLKSAAEEALLHGDDAVTPERLQQLFIDNPPYAKANPDSVARLRAWAAESAVNASAQS